MKFDVPMLNMLVKYLMSPQLTKVNVNNLYTLFDKLDMDTYSYNQQIYDRVLLIKYIADAKANHNMKELELIQTYVVNTDGSLREICNEFTWEDPNLASSEIKYISDNIAERLQYIYLFEAKDIIMEKMNKVERADFISYYEIVNDLKKELSQLLVKLQNSSIGDGLVRRFSFADDTFRDILDIILQKAKKPTAILQTGIRQLNAILSPGFQSGRIYVFLGLTGKFKSGTLLNIADQIRTFNPQLNPVEDGKRKTILFVTMENTINETVERLVDMYSDPNDEMRNMELDEVIDILRTRGKYIFTADKGIDIEMRFYSNLEINTSDLYAIVQDIEDNGKKVIALILDYLLKIDSTHNSNGDERIRLSYATKELKSVAQFFEIPVITAMQVNREGNSIIDAAMREDKQDLLNYIGAAQIGNCWNIVEESDWMALVSLERRKSTGQLFLSCKRLKIRGKKDPLASDYFNHPFANEKEIRLETDVDKPNPVSIISLASDLESVNTEELENSPQIRPKLYKNRKPNVLEPIDTAKLLSDLQRCDG